MDFFFIFFQLFSPFVKQVLIYFKMYVVGSFGTYIYSFCFKLYVVKSFFTQIKKTNNFFVLFFIYVFYDFFIGQDIKTVKIKSECLSNICIENLKRHLL